MAVIADQPNVDLREPKGWRRTSNRIMTWLMMFSFVLVIIPLVFVFPLRPRTHLRVDGWLGPPRRRGVGGNRGALEFRSTGLHRRVLPGKFKGPSPLRGDGPLKYRR